MPPKSLPPLSAEDLFRLTFVGMPRISPDGRWIVYTVKEGLLEENTYATNLWLVSTGEGPPRRLTFGRQNDVLPRWSPDGRTIAFISNRKDKKLQVYLLPMDGGEARPLTDLDGAFGALEWSPDGRRLVFGFRPLSDEEKARREALKNNEAEKRPAYKHLRNLRFKEDGLGFRFETHQHLYTVDVETGAVLQLTEGIVDDVHPVYSPDGRHVAFESNRMPDPYLQVDNTDICLVPAAGGGITGLTTAYGPNMSPSFSPDGKHIAFLGHFGGKGESFWRDCHVWLVPTSGGEPRNLTPGMARTAGNFVIADTRDLADMFEAPLWSPDGKHLTFLLSDSGGTVVCRVPVSGGDVQRLTSGHEDLGSLTQDKEGKLLACVRADHTRPAEVGVLALGAGGEARMLTRHNEAFLAERWVGEPEEFWITTEPGVRIQGWILKPPGFQAGTKYPALLEIHGGPHVQYGKTFMHEFQYLAGKGFVVLWTNPRGSQGYGETHAGAIVRNWGGPDYKDLMAAVDHLVAQGYVDAKRLGVTGGSYGGYMTNWIIGHTDRFRAAASQRAVVNLYSMFGESDFGYDFEFEFGGRPWQDEEMALRYLRMSPIHYVQHMKTPLLISHAEEDHRCPISQAEELFTALKLLGQEVEFVRWEGESHGLSRGGRPQNRRERLRRLGDWFDRHLTAAGR